MNNDKPTIEAELLPLTVVDNGVTSKGTKMYICTFEVQPGMPEFSATAYSTTIAQDLEKAIADNKKVKLGYYKDIWKNQIQWKIRSVDGKTNSGFAKGKGFQKDTVSIERQASAKIAVDLIQYADLKEIKDVGKTWEKLADKVYIWISARPSEPQASGGSTDQKIDLNDLPPEFR